MREQELNQLFAKYLRKECDEQELELLFTYFDEVDYEDSLKNLIEENWSEELSDNLDFQLKMRHAFLKTDQHLAQYVGRDSSKRFARRFIRWMPYAAACLLLAVSLSYYVFILNSDTTKKTVTELVSTLTVQPKLKFANGQEVVLDTLINGRKLLFENSRARVVQISVDKIQVYNNNSQSDIMEWVQLDVPKGKHVQVILADGSSALVNSMSEFKFPLLFNTDKRQTELVGEGYFEVAHVNNKAFYVKTPDQLIQVFGTKFNVRNYGDEDVSSTALFEGKVSVKVIRDNQIEAERFLKPGDQLDIPKDQKEINQKTITDHAEILGWTKGKFVYNNTPLKVMLKDLTRWYNVEVDWETVPNLRFQGTIPQDYTIVQVLDLLNEVGNLQIKLINNQLTFKK
ncbi:FecR family protein [Sphingobacterium sp. ML3W]|uniref:FecR family protein n=1 Tax=Sphingobacterium sp. ML3W TaxID=1538644 RepID=UPI00068DFBE1|nr:FecR family protein [Sphingobacterium sp. ML3W]